MQAELFDLREPLPPAWDAFVRAQRLAAPWRAGAMAAVGADWAGRAWAGMVWDGAPVAALCFGRLVSARPLGGLLVSRVRLLSGPGVAVAGGLDEAGGRAAVAAFERALFRRLGRSRCLAVAYQQVPDDQVGRFDGGRRPRFATGPVSWLENRWASMDEYWAWLPKARRKKLRRAWRRVEQDPTVTMRWSEGPLDGRQAAELGGLIGRTIDRRRRGPRRPWAPGAPPTGLLSAVSACGGTGRLTYRDEAGRLLGASLLFDTGERLLAPLWGSLHLGEGGRRDLYFHKYLWQIRRMIERQRHGIDYGLELVDLKRRLGCVATSRCTVVGRRPGPARGWRNAV